MKLKLSFTAALVLFLLPLCVLAGKPPVAKWTVKNAFDQKVFIENKGQYGVPSPALPSDAILFGAKHEGLFYYFTKNSIWIRKNAAVKRTDEEIEKMQKNGKIEADKEEEMKYK